MKTLAALALLAPCLYAAPIRVAVLDFETATGGALDSRLAGKIPPQRVAEKGPFSLGRQWSGHEAFRLIDRRDLMRQLEQLRLEDQGRPTPVRPSVLRAAQAVEADLILRGTLASLSTARQTVQQGGYRTDQETLSLRVYLEALDAVDGSIVGLEEGVARETVRQTAEVQTEIGEDELIALLDQAVAQAAQLMEKRLIGYQQQLEKRTRHTMTLRTTADPALVELDGMLIGSTPLEGFALYPGDHTLSITKPGFQSISKKLMIDRNVQIEVPMFREQLSADEIKAIYEKGQISIYQGITPNWIIQEIR